MNMLCYIILYILYYTILYEYSSMSLSPVVHEEVEDRVQERGADAKHVETSA
jgi:hypothetical protein